MTGVNIELDNKTIERIGHQLAKGFFKEFWNSVFIISAAWILLSLAVNQMDDSDTSFTERSGLKVHLDAKTGVEYLSDGRGGLIRREK